MDLATRRVARRVTVGAAGTQRHMFGPFLPGEQLEGIQLYLASDVAAPAPGEVVQVQVKTFNDPPPDTAAAFLANGRTLTGATGVAADQPRLPILGALLAATAAVGFSGYLPVGFQADLRERFVGVEITELNGDNLTGSLWCDIDSTRVQQLPLLPLPKDAAVV